MNRLTATTAGRGVRELVDSLAAAELTRDEAFGLHALAVHEIRRTDEGALSGGFLEPDGALLLARWATRLEQTDRSQSLLVDTDELPIPMVGTPATGRPLVSNRFLGVDLIRLPAAHSFAPHTHPGDHLLIVVGGQGTITYDGRIYPTEAGQVYMIEGQVPHAVGAITNHVILAVGAPHKPVHSPDRQQLTDRSSIDDTAGELRCLLCGVTARAPERLIDLGCPHDPACPEQ